MIVDSHQHFWDPALADYPWMTDEVAALRRRYWPEDLEPTLREHGVRGTVLVQARGSLDETRTLIEIAAGTPFVLGVVGWIDLTDANAAAVLGELGGRLVGVRHQVHDESDPSWLLRADVRRGLAAVAESGLVFDLLVRAAELPAAVETARRLPELRLVLDHLGKPSAGSAWADGVAALADLPNVSCKLSGLVTEVPTTEVPSYVERGLRWFGADRCMFGSDWPVCLLAADYGAVLALVREAVPEDERDMVLAGTAVRTYGLEP
jgi:L-fuconolactonase